MTSCMGGLQYKMDTTAFKMITPAPPSRGPVPDTYIDTNMSISGMFGGKIRTRKPYAVGSDYTDESFTLEAVEFTRVMVTYGDGTADPGAAAFKLPRRFDARPYESYNSMSGGRVVKSTVNSISGKLRGVITRDEDFTLLLEGTVIKKDGTREPFNLKERYEPIRDTTTRSWAEVISEV
ncbi:hypothetical protein [Haloferula helveola]